ncbi:MAG: hypothetical protein WCT77_01955 [Bacteroidota bacterium]|jgi:hypothetical protein
MKIKTKLNKTEALDAKGTIWNKERIQKLLDTNNEAVYRAMLRIYDRQTRTEQINQNTEDWNSVGFTGVDGEIMSSFTEAYKKYGRLTEKQMNIARKKMKKYWKQLLDCMKQENSQMLKIR